ncbi:MAG: MBL fold metallo-hydrolase [Chloroflexota bacterium]
MSIEIKHLTLGMVATNTYLVADTDTNRAVLIDPVDDAERLHQWATDNDWEIALILATHAHFDHILASGQLVELTGAPFWLHEEAANRLTNLPTTGVRLTGQAFPEAATHDKLIADNEVVELDSMRFEALYTPGHAPGHLSFYMASEGAVFSGDALFQGTIGRTDLEGGSLQLLMESITTRLIPLGDDTRVLPGHGAETTIGRERRVNPYILQYGG